MRMRACVVACFAGFLTATTGALAQDAPQPAKPAAEGTLPEVVVDTAAQPKKAPAKKKKTAKSKGTGQATGTPTASAEPTKATGDKAETAYGPVKGYAATRSATGSKTDTPIKEIPQSISVVGAEQIRDMGAQTVQEVLRYVPGVVADAYGLDSRGDSEKIRGIDAIQFLDGLRRTFSYYSFDYRIDPYFMERIEVLRGPASVLFGTAPVGGIINSVSKRPQDEQASEITVEYGTFDFKQVKFDTTGSMTPDGKWTYRLTGLARDADTQVNYVEDDRYAIQPAITFRPDSATAITVIGHLQKDETGSTGQFYPHIGSIYPNVNGRRVPQDRFAGEPDDYYDTEVASVTLLFEHQLNSVFKLQHSSRYADIQNDYDSTYSGWSYVDADQEQVIRSRWLAFTDTQVFDQDTNLEAKFATGPLSHRLLGGINYTHFEANQKYNWAYDANPFNIYDPVYGQAQWMVWDCALNDYAPADDLETCYSDDQTVAQTGLYVQDQLRLGNWIAVLGARKDWLRTTPPSGDKQKDEAVTYRAGLMYEFASGLTPYASYAESFVPVVGRSADGSAFDPQRGQMYEAGFKYQPVGSNFAINGAVYDIDESSLLVTDAAGIGTQTGAVSIKGFEIEITGQVTENLKVAGGYSYTDAKYSAGTYVWDPRFLDYIAVGGNQIESVPEHLASLWGVWEFDQPYLKGWSVGAGVRYIGASWDATNSIKVPDVALFDAMVAYEQDHWRWSINARNLEDKEYWTTCLSRGDCFIGTARTITTGLTYKF